MSMLNRNEARIVEASRNSDSRMSTRQAHWALEQAIEDDPAFVLERLEVLKPEDIGVPADLFNEYHAAAKAMCDID